MNKTWCGLIDDDPNIKSKQCCCNCIFHLPVHYHCCTSPKPSEAERKASNNSCKCVCGTQKGWACVYITDNELKEAVVYDNWHEHSIGCELYTPRIK